MIWIDSHAHINDEAFDADRQEVITRVFQSGISKFVEIACEKHEWAPALALCEKYSAQTAAVLGMHPQMAQSYDDAARAQLKELLKSPHAAAVGEIGLDYAYLHACPADKQLSVFEEMLALANDVQKPIVLHVRREAEDFTPYNQTFDLLKHVWKPAGRLKYPGVLHCFSARYEEAKKALDNGLLLGLNGCFTYKKNEYIREAVKKAGADKLVLETDCPYLSPQGKRGTRNDPSNIPLIGQWVADYLNMPVEKLAEITTQNALDLYELN